MKRGVGSTERFFVHRLAAEQYLVAGFSQYGFSLLHIGEFPYLLPFEIDCYAGIKDGRLWILAPTARGVWWRQKIKQQNNQLYVGQRAIISFSSNSHLEKKTKPFETPTLMKLEDILFLRQADSYMAIHLTAKSMNRPHSLPPSWQHLHCCGFLFSHFDNHTALQIQDLQKIYPQSMFIDVSNKALNYFQNETEIGKKIKPWRGFFHWKLFSCHYAQERLIIEHPQWLGNVSIKLPETWVKASSSITLSKTDKTLHLDWKNWPLADGSAIEYVNKVPSRKTHWLANIAQLQKKYRFMFQNETTTKSYAELLHWLAILRPLLMKFQEHRQQKLCSLLVPHRILKAIQPLWFELAPLLQKGKHIKEKSEFYKTVLLTASGSVYGLLQDNGDAIKEHRLWYQLWRQSSAFSLRYWRTRQWLKFAWLSLIEGQAKSFWNKYKNDKSWIRRAKPLGICLAALFLLFPLSFLDSLAEGVPSFQKTAQSFAAEESLLATAHYTTIEQQSFSPRTSQESSVPTELNKDGLASISAKENADAAQFSEEHLINSLANEQGIFYVNQSEKNITQEEKDDNITHYVFSEDPSYQRLENSHFSKWDTKNNDIHQQDSPLTKIQDSLLDDREQEQNNLAQTPPSAAKVAEKNVVAPQILATSQTNDAKKDEVTVQKSLGNDVDKLKQHFKESEQSPQVLAVSQELGEESQTIEQDNLKKEENIIGILHIDTQESRKDKENKQQKLDKLLNNRTSADELLRIMSARLEKERQIQQQLNSEG